ncbi:unnamed protein product [Closterium sp. Naga37s-1]|nr:unnamed protein product [Closterium sp. Naga37s-1]
MVVHISAVTAAAPPPRRRGGERSRQRRLGIHKAPTRRSARLWHLFSDHALAGARSRGRERAAGAAGAGHSGDPVGVAARESHVSREKYRAMRLQQYKSHKNLNVSLNVVDMEVQQVTTGITLYGFAYITRAVKSPIVHFQLRTSCAGARGAGGAGGTGGAGGAGSAAGRAGGGSGVELGPSARGRFTGEPCRLLQAPLVLAEAAAEVTEAGEWR